MVFETRNPCLVRFSSRKATLRIQRACSEEQFKLKGQSFKPTNETELMLREIS